MVNDAHTLYLIVDADSKERVDSFMTPFAQVGMVEVLPASWCEARLWAGWRRDGRGVSQLTP